MTRAVGAQEAIRQSTCKAKGRKPQRQGVWYDDGLQSPKGIHPMQKETRWLIQGRRYRKPSASRAVLTTRYVMLHNGGGLDRGPGAEGRTSGAAWWLVAHDGRMFRARLHSTTTDTLSRETK